MSTEDVSLTKEKQFHSLYVDSLYNPFKDQYEDKWEEEPFWAAVEVFKVQAKEIGYEEPLERLSSCYGKISFEQLRDDLKSGPPAFGREGWTSPYTGEKIDVLSVLEAIHYVQGPKYEGKERIVILDFWATWCKPCVNLALELSDLSEKYAGQVAVIGINNEGVFGRHPGTNDLEGVKEFIETKKENFRYSTYIDNADEHARDQIFRKIEFLAIPCLVLVVDNEVKYAGGSTRFDEHFDAVLKELYPKEA